MQYDAQLRTDTKHFFTSFEGNGVIKNYVTRLIRGRKLISVTQSYIKGCFVQSKMAQNFP